MSLNYANGVEFWNVKDNTPQNGSKLTDAQGNELTFGGGGGGVTLVPMTITEDADYKLTYTIQMTASELFSLMKTGIPVVSSENETAGEETIGYIYRATMSASEGYSSFYINWGGEGIRLDANSGNEFPTYAQE